MEVEDARSCFPALDQRLRGKPLIYLDSAATTLKPRSVVERISNYYLYESANVHRGSHYLSDQATALFESAREAVRGYINANDSSEILFSSGTTDSINLVARGFLKPQLQPGDEILLTEMEHHSNIVPWQMIAKETGATIKWLPISASGEIDLNEVDDALTPRVKIFAFTHESNVLGTHNPVAQLSALARKKNIPVLIDGAQTAGHEVIDVQVWGCDFLVFSSHKMYGPTGFGVLFARKEHFEKMKPIKGGGGMIQSVSTTETLFGAAPFRYEAGTPHIEGAVGLHSAIQFIEAIGRKQIFVHELSLRNKLDRELESLKGVRILGPSKSKGALTSFVISGAHPSDLGALLDQEGVAVRVGHLCAQPLMDRMGVPGVVRVSFGIYNKLWEIDKFMESLEKSLSVLGVK